jgi:hypothetical protein
LIEENHDPARVDVECRRTDRCEISPLLQTRFILAVAPGDLGDALVGS